MLLELATSVNVVKLPLASDSCRKKVFPTENDAAGEKEKLTGYVLKLELAQAAVKAKVGLLMLCEKQACDKKVVTKMHVKTPTVLVQTFMVSKLWFKT